jgi:hypothetical protein
MTFLSDPCHGCALDPVLNLTYLSFEIAANDRSPYSYHSKSKRLLENLFAVLQVIWLCFAEAQF